MKIKIAMFFTIFLLPLGLSNISIADDSVIGTWKTIDDNTGDPKSIVRLFKQDNKLYGEVIRLFRNPDEDQDPLCEKCTDHRKDKNILGMQVIDGLTYKNGKWRDGEILDPESGTKYKCEIWRNKENLSVRGYVFLFFRTQTWVKYENTQIHK